MSLQSFCMTAFLIRRPMIGCASVVLDPMTRIAFACSMSSIVLVIAPLPNVFARPATVGACHNRAQWSTLLVPTTARVNFWMR